MPRIFIGTFLSFEDQQKLAHIAAENHRLEEIWQLKPRWTKASKLHLTWLFIGSIDDQLVPKLSSTLTRTLSDRAKILGKEGRKELLVEFNKPEAWPSARKPRMVVLSSERVQKEVHVLASTIRKGLIPFFTEETEQEHNLEFRPHLTIIRLDRRIKDTSNDQEKIDRIQVPEFDPRLDVLAIKSLKETLPLKLKISEICVIESHSRRGADDYKIVSSVKI